MPKLGRSPEEGNGYPLQYSYLENPRDREAWWAIVHGVAKSHTWLSDLGHRHTHTHIHTHTRDICCCSDPMDWSMSGFTVLHHRLELAQTHVHWVGDVIQPSRPLSSLSPPAFNLSQHQGLFQWVSSSHQVAKLLEFQLQHQSFECIFRIDFF